jgi:hypothetical protein
LYLLTHFLNRACLDVRPGFHCRAPFQMPDSKAISLPFVNDVAPIALAYVKPLPRKGMAAKLRNAWSYHDALSAAGEYPIG